MPLEKWSDDVAVVHLADDPQYSEDMDALERAVKSAGVKQAVLDFQQVRALNSSNLGRLIQLRKQLVEKGGKAVLCSIPNSVWGTFLVTGIDKLFTCSDNVPTALATLQLGVE
jgi:anti-anti-sigma factor